MIVRARNGWKQPGTPLVFEISSVHVGRTIHYIGIRGIACLSGYGAAQQHELMSFVLLIAFARYFVQLGRWGTALVAKDLSSELALEPVRLSRSCLL